MSSRSLHLWALAGAALMAAGVQAQTPPAPATTPQPGETLSLTPEEKARLLEQNTEDSVDAARAGLPSGGPHRQIHGEIGAMIGTNGARGIYGTAAVPLGDNAGAIISVEDSRFGRIR
jgi:hypothetical protein